MPRKKKERLNEFKVFEVVDEVLSVHNPQEAVAPIVEDSAKTLRELQKAMGEYKTRILSTAALKTHKIPSANACLQYGYILTYLMPNSWLLTTVNHISNKCTLDGDQL